jgi:hypothetical protein
MKALTLIVIAACALIGCDGDSSSATNGSSTATDQLSAVGKTQGQAFPVAAPSPPEVDFSGAVTNRRDAGQVADSKAAAFAGEAGSQAASGADPLQSVTGATTGAPAMMIRIGQAFIEVEKVDPAILKIRQLAAQVGGYVANSSVSGGRDQIRQATLELKLPAPKYDEAVSSLSTIGKVETVNSTAQDVGEEFVDVSARVKNARRLEERLITLLETRTGKLDEVLRVERELARVREEIERYEGRLRFLSSRVAMSTLTITIHEPSPILGNNPGENPIAAALRRAWKNFVGFVAALISSLGVVIPLALIGLAGWAGYRRWKRR